MRNAGLDEAQSRIKIAGRNVNNLRYTDNTTLTAESEEEVKSLLIKVKEESEKVGLKLNIGKTKIMASGLITSWQIDGVKIETGETLFLGLQNHCRWWLQPWNYKMLLWRKALTNLDSILKSRDVILPTNICVVKAMVVMYRCESWTIKKAECRRIDACKLWCWRRRLKVPWTARSN